MVSERLISVSSSALPVNWKRFLSFISGLCFGRLIVTLVYRDFWVVGLLGSSLRQGCWTLTVLYRCLLIDCCLLCLAWAVAGADDVSDCSCSNCCSYEQRYACNVYAFGDPDFSVSLDRSLLWCKVRLDLFFFRFGRL